MGKGKRIRFSGHLRKMTGILSVSALCIFTGLAGYICEADTEKKPADAAEEKIFSPGITASAAEAVSAERVYDSAEEPVMVSDSSAVRNTNGGGYICLTVGAFEDNFGNYIYRFQFINENDSEAMSKYYVE